MKKGADRRQIPDLVATNHRFRWPCRQQYLTKPNYHAMEFRLMEEM
jgi:hypothetical protein